MNNGVLTLTKFSVSFSANLNLLFPSVVLKKLRSWKFRSQR